MPDTYKVLSQTQLPTSAAAQYTVPGATSAIIRSMVLVNTTASPVTVNLFVNGTGAGNKILDTYSIPANTRIELNAVLCLAAANTVQASASAGSAVTMTISGLEIS